MLDATFALDICAPFHTISSAKVTGHLAITVKGVPAGTADDVAGVVPNG